MAAGGAGKDEPAALTIGQTRSLFEGRTEMVANRQLYFEAYGRQKRSAPSPTQSCMTTPQEAVPPDTGAASSSGVGEMPGLVTQTPVEDQVAFQATAGKLGYDFNSPQAVEQFLETKVNTARDVLKIMRGYHAAVIRPEVYGMVIQLEGALKTIQDSVFATQSELRFMAAENRASQKHQSGLMLVTTGWPQGMNPGDRHFMLGWMLSQVPECVKFLQNRRLLDNDSDHTALPSQVWFNCLTTDPTTIPQGGDFYSAMTMLSFKAWDIRSAFLSRFGGTSGTPLYSNMTTPLSGRHIRVSPCAPQWQRKLEAPLRVLIAVVNAHEECEGKRLVILWKSLTLMAPTDSPDFHPDLLAWARLFYEERAGTFVGRLEVGPELSRLMMSPAQNADSGEESLWAEKWNEVIWGNQYQMDQLDHAAYNAAKQEAKTSGRGISYPGGRKHWSNALLHNSYFSPYPFELELVQVESVAFIWDGDVQKAGHPNEAVGDLKACTFGGKPQISADVDIEMTTPPEDSAATAKSKAAPPLQSRPRVRQREPEAPEKFTCAWT